MRRSTQFLLLQLPIIIFIFSSITFYAQIDSLYEKLEKTDISILDTNLYELYLDIGEVYKRSDPDSTIKYAVKAYEVAKAIQDSKRIQKASYGLGIRYRRKGDLETAKEYLNIATTETNLSNWKGHSYRVKGDINLDYHEYEKAEQNYKSAIEVGQELSDTVLISIVYGALARYYNQQQDFKTSIEYLLISANLYKDFGDSLNYAKNIRNLSLLLIRNKEFDKALEYTRESKLYTPLDDNNSQGAILSMEGSALEGLQQYSKSIEKFNQAIPLFKAAKNLKQVNSMYLNLVLTYIKIERDDEALVIAKDRLPNLVGTTHQFRFNQIIAYLLFAKGKCTEASSFINKASAYIGAIKHWGMKSDYHNTKAKILLCDGKLSASLPHFDSTSMSRDSMFYNESTSDFRRLETQFRTRVKQDSIQILSLKNTNQLASITNKNRLLTFTSLFALLLTGIAWLYRNYFKIQEKLNDTVSREKALIEEKRKRLELDNQELIFKKSELEQVNGDLKLQIAELESNKTEEPAIIGIQKRGKKHLIKVDTIKYIESEDKGSRFHLLNGTDIWDDTSLKHWVAELPVLNFPQIHKSFIVNRTCISWINYSKLSLYDGLELPIGRVYKKNLE